MPQFSSQRWIAARGIIKRLPTRIEGITPDRKASYVFALDRFIVAASSWTELNTGAEESKLDDCIYVVLLLLWTIDVYKSNVHTF